MDMAATAEEFFVAVRDDDMDKAMTCLSEDFQASTPLAELRRFLDANGLNRFREARWARARATAIRARSPDRSRSIPAGLSHLPSAW